MEKNDIKYLIELCHDKVLEEYGIDMKVISQDAQSDDEYDLLINGTPAGMYPKFINDLPANEKLIKNCKNVFDAVYNPNETVLLSEAIKAGAKPVYGIKMLLYQGAESFEIWTGRKAPIDVMHDALTKTLGL